MDKIFAINVVPRYNGKYKYITKYIDPLESTTNHIVKKTVSVTLSKNTKQSMNKARELLSKKIEDKIATASGKTQPVTLEYLSNQYLKQSKEKNAVNTWYKKKASVKRLLSDLGNNTLVSNINASSLNEYFDDLLYKNNLSNDTVSSYKSILNQIFQLGIRYGMIKDNPVTEVKPAYRDESIKRKDEIENKYLEDNEVKEIINYLHAKKRDDIINIIKFQLYTGTRFGEAAGLQVKNIIKRNNHYFARITGSLTRNRDKTNTESNFIKTGSAKTEAGNRDIVLQQACIDLINSLIKDKQPDDFIFANKLSKSKGFFDESKVNKVLKTVSKNIKCNKKLTTHIFRHTHASKLAEQGISLNVIQKRLGHGNSRITSQIYLHITNQMIDDQVNKLNEIYS